MVSIYKRLLAYFFVFFCILQGGYCNATDKVWVLVDTKAKQVDVKKGSQTLESFSNIAIGRKGAGFKEQRGDFITPLGTYKIGWINRNSHYRLFFGFDYPSLNNAKRALQDGLISRRAFQKIAKAHQKNRVPPQNTAMGGQIGIHGLGLASKLIHDEFDWTRGCIALTNQQIDRLARWISKGTLVKVK